MKVVLEKRYLLGLYVGIYGEYFRIKLLYRYIFKFYGNLFYLELIRFLEVICAFNIFGKVS